MGKKDNTKAKEKRAERKAQERRMYEIKELEKQTLDAKLNAAKANVKAANMADDPLGILPKPFSVYNKNGLDLQLETLRASDLDEKTLDWAFDTVKTSMKPLYDEAHKNDPEDGWREDAKKGEMREDMAWILLAKTQDGAPVAFSHFRYQMNDDDEVLYCYDLQVMETYRRKGLGKFMMKVLEMLMIKADMLKIMCIIFKNDNTGVDFFKTALNYDTDETNLEGKHLQYEIISRYNQIKKRQKMEEERQRQNFFSHGAGGCAGAGCCSPGMPSGAPSYRQPKSMFNKWS